MLLTKLADWLERRDLGAKDETMRYERDLRGWDRWYGLGTLTRATFISSSYQVLPRKLKRLDNEHLQLLAKLPSRLSHSFTQRITGGTPSLFSPFFDRYFLGFLTRLSLATRAFPPRSYFFNNKKSKIEYLSPIIRYY